VEIRSPDRKEINDEKTNNRSVGLPNIQRRMQARKLRSEQPWAQITRSDRALTHSMFVSKNKHAMRVDDPDLASLDSSRARTTFSLRNPLSMSNRAAGNHSEPNEVRWIKGVGDARRERRPVFVHDADRGKTQRKLNRRRIFVTTTKGAGFRT
jgi:hypothetical protein